MSYERDKDRRISISELERRLEALTKELCTMRDNQKMMTERLNLVLHEREMLIAELRSHKEELYKRINSNDELTRELALKITNLQKTIDGQDGFITILKKKEEDQKEQRKQFKRILWTTIGTVAAGLLLNALVNILKP